MSRPTTRRGGRSHHGIDAEQILDAAIAIGDVEGLEALTMRRLADRVRIGTMTLYSYFAGKDELLDAMADGVLGKLQLPTGKGKHPDDVIRMIAHAFRQMMRDHPSVVRLLTSRSTTSHGAMAGGYEQPLQVLIDAGLDPPEAVRIYGVVLTYVLGFVTYEQPRTWGRDDSPEDGERRRMRKHFYEALPRDRFPVLTGASETLVSLPTDEQFEWGLDALIAGVTARSAEVPPTRY